MSEADPSPLPADPARQATAMLSACEYQILQTVNAWLDLRGTDLLFVEGAEDFDVDSGTKAEAVQVKTSPAPISLGQADIRNTISQYWQLKLRASDRDVRLKYLTRASVATEQERPFGPGVAGLDLWRRRLLTNVEVMTIRDYLLSKSDIRDPLRTWLLGADAEEIRDDLIHGISWVTHADDAGGVQRSILCKLLAFAEIRERVPASVIRQVADSLIQEVWLCLRAEGTRSLDSYRLEEIWERETHVSLPRSAVVARLNMSAGNRGVMAGCVAELLRAGLPQLPGIVAPRVELVDAWRRELSETGTLNLHGSARTGKTTLAKLIASADEESWRWWSASGKSAEEVIQLASILVWEIAKDPGITDVVLDDLELSGAILAGIEEPMGEIAALLKGRGGRMLVTSQKPFPSRLLHLLGVDNAQVKHVPRLSLEEVIELAGAFGCSEPEKCTAWGSVVHASTGGHPQLAAVQLLALKNEGWPSTASGLFESGMRAVEGEKAEALQLLIDTLPEPKRELLQRMSAFPAYFRRDQAVALGAIPPPIGSPGTAFDFLVGPWVEPLHDGYFSLSPLLGDYAKQALTRKDFDDLQESAAFALLKSKPCTQVEFGHAFLLFWRTRNGGALTWLVQGWLDSEEPLAGALSLELWWLTLVSTEPGQRLFEGNVSLSLILRAIQFRIAMHTAPARLKRLVDAWRWELDNSEHPEPLLMKSMFAGYVLINQQVRVTGTEIVDMMSSFRDALSKYPDLPFATAIPKGGHADLGYLPEWNDPVATLSLPIALRCDNYTFLEDLLLALDSQDVDLRNSVLKGFVCSGAEVQMALDRVWLSEGDREDPDWEQCLRVFGLALELGRKWSCAELATSAMRSTTVVVDEYLSDHLRAHELLTEMSEPGDLSDFAVYDRRASIFFSQKDYSSAEDAWSNALGCWPDPVAPFDTGAAYAARSAGVAASRQERWGAAADWFQESVRRLPKMRQAAFVAGCLADAGYCLWRSKAKIDAIGLLIDAWKLADTLPVGKEDLLAFKTRKTIGHVIAWIHGTETDFGTGELHEPIAGTCSTLEVPEQLRELPETESANVWLFLKRIERELHAGTRAAELGSAVVAGTQSLVTGSIAALDGVATLLASGEASELPGAVIDMARRLGDAMKNVPGHADPDRIYPEAEVLNEADLLCGKTVFIAGLIAGRGVGSDWRMVLDQWRHSLPAGAKGGWIEWFDTIEKTMGNSAAMAERLAKSGEGGWELSLLAAWSLLEAERVSAEQLYVGHARIVAQPQQFYWLREVSRAFCGHVQRRWLQLSECPALLCMPRVSVGAIRSACASGEPGIPKAARILVAASAAVRTKVPGEMMAAIRRLANVKDRE